MAGIFPPCECTEGMQKLKSNGIPDRHLKAWPLRWWPFFTPGGLTVTGIERTGYILLPQMEENPYNLIAFQSDAYTEAAQLAITPTPDTVLRVFMAWKPLEEPVELPPQELAGPERSGFTVVEWGGCQVK